VFMPRLCLLVRSSGPSLLVSGHAGGGFYSERSAGRCLWGGTDYRCMPHAPRPPVWLVCEVFFARDWEHLRGWFTQQQERVKLWLFSANMVLPQAPGPQLRAVLFQSVSMTSTCGTLVCAVRERSLCSETWGRGCTLQPLQQAYRHVVWSAV